MTLIERVEGQIVTPDGEVANRPATIIGADAAAILRNYFYWTLLNQLEPELFCNTCYNGTRESKAVHHVTESEIQIICGCSIRFFRGTWLKPFPIPASKSCPADATGPLQVQLSDEAASLLRLNKKVLIDLGLKQALRCNACFALNLMDGCDTQVTTNSIVIRCRCSTRTYHGMSA